MEILIEPILWTYKLLNNGEFMILIRLTKYKDVRYLPTGFSSSSAKWDASSPEHGPAPGHPQYKAITKKIDSLTDETKFQIKLAEQRGELETLTMAALKASVVKRQAGVKPKKILEFFDEIINSKEDADNPGYADIFTACKATVVKLLSGFSVDKVTKEYLKENQASLDKPFTSFTAKDFSSYETFINSLKKETTKSLYLRTLYRAWNMAIEKKFCPESHHPQTFIKYDAYKRIRREKRAIPFKFIKDMESLQFGYETRLFRSQQFAKFCYYCRGLNFGDMVKLLHGKNVREYSVSYTRSKNHREYDFRLHSKAKEVLEVFRTYPMRSDAGYVFPILMRHHDTARKIDQRIQSALSDFNEDLEEMEKKIKSPKKLRSNVLRHSFATNLRHKKVDIGLIKEALGHETEGQTQEYLEEIDDATIADSIEAALQ